jgi:outer membrane immunogenic protein
MHPRGRFRTLTIGELNMKKLILALTAAAAFSAPVLAADMAPRAYTKAPVAVASVVNWTGCYVGGGGGYGMWNQENTHYDDRNVLAGKGPRILADSTTTTGGRGYFGTVQGGCDYQFGMIGQQFVVGAFADYDFASLTGRLNPPGSGIVGDEKMSSAWAVGGRIGWLAFPQLLTYFSGGFTEATFDRVDFFNTAPPGLTSNLYMDKRTYKGWFLGAGDEYALSFLPGLFWKTEYRFSQFDLATNPFYNATTGARTIDSLDSKKWTHTIRSELVYRFNWGGAVVAKY